MDAQTCTIIIGSWAHDGAMIDMRIPTNQTTVDVSDLVKNREWRLESTSIKKRDHFFDCCPGVPFPDIKMTFQLVREGATHNAAVVVPGLGRIFCHFA